MQSRRKSSRVRGSVIVMVLVMIMVASLLLSRFIERTTTELFVESRALQRDRLRLDAHSALEATLAVLADFRETDGGLRSPAQGWGDALERARFQPRRGTSVEVSFLDESGKPSLPRMTLPALQQLGVLLGLTPTEAARFGDSLLTWTRAEHVPLEIGNDPRDYERADPPHRPPQRPLRRFAELRSVDGAREFFFDDAGRPTPLLAQFERSVSLFDFTASNLNAADPTALALAGWDPKQMTLLEEFLSGRSARPAGSPPFFRSVAEATALLGAAVPVTGFEAEVKCLRVRVTVREGATAFRLEVVVAGPAAAAAPGGAPATPQNAESAEPPAAPETPLKYPFVLLELTETVEPLAKPADAN